MCNLLLLTEGENHHLCWIKNPEYLFRDDNQEKRYPCMQCLTKSFNSQENLDKHQEVCFQNEAVNCILPAENSKIRFKNEQNKFKHPFSIYADFESTLRPLETSYCFEDERYQKHTANSIAIKFNCIHNEYSKKIEHHSNEDPEKVLKYAVEKIEEHALYSYKTSQQNKNKYILTDEQKHYHNFCLKCDECNENFKEDNKKVIHHDHITGDYISTLCNSCNLKFKVKKFIPIYFHNLKGYDSHLIIKSLNDYGYKSETEDNIHCIANTEEKYISFSKKIPVEH